MLSRTTWSSAPLPFHKTLRPFLSIENKTSSSFIILSFITYIHTNACNQQGVRTYTCMIRRYASSIISRHYETGAELGLRRTPGQVLSIDVHKLTVQKIHENINGKIDNIQKAPSRSNIFILLQQLIQVQR